MDTNHGTLHGTLHDHWNIDENHGNINENHGKNDETMEKTMKPIENSKGTIEKSTKTMEKWRNTMEKLMKTTEKSMNTLEQTMNTMEKSKKTTHKHIARGSWVWSEGLVIQSCNWVCKESKTSNLSVLFEGDYKLCFFLVTWKTWRTWTIPNFSGCDQAYAPLHIQLQLVPWAAAWTRVLSGFRFVDTEYL